MTAPARLALGVLGLLGHHDRGLRSDRSTDAAGNAGVRGAAARAHASRARLDEPQAPEDEADRVRLAGGGLGIRLREDARLALNYDNTERYSPVPSREYSRGRLYATLNYGF